MDNSVRVILDQLYQLRDQQGPHALYAAGSGTVALTTAPQTIASLTLDRDGEWLIVAVASTVVTGADTGQDFTLSLQQQNQTLRNVAMARFPTTATTLPVMGVWRIKAKQNDSVRAQIKKAGGGGTSSVDGANSTLTALWQGV